MGHFPWSLFKRGVPWAPGGGLGCGKSGGKGVAGGARAPHVQPCSLIPAVVLPHSSAFCSDAAALAPAQHPAHARRRPGHPWLKHLCEALKPLKASQFDIIFYKNALRSHVTALITRCGPLLREPGVAVNSECT